jgi:hypothetical protein
MTGPYRSRTIQLKTGRNAADEVVDPMGKVPGCQLPVRLASISVTRGYQTAGCMEGKAMAARVYQISTGKPSKERNWKQKGNEQVKEPAGKRRALVGAI